MQQRVTVSGFIYDQGKTLLLRRGLQESFLPGHWEVPGGKLELGEDPYLGVLREVREEASLDCEVIGIHHVWGDVTDYKGEETHFVEICFILKMKPGQSVKPGDGMDDSAWIIKSDIGKYKISQKMMEEINSGFAWVAKNLK